MATAQDHTSQTTRLGLQTEAACAGLFRASRGPLQPASMLGKPGCLHTLPPASRPERNPTRHAQHPAALPQRAGPAGTEGGRAAHRLSAASSMEPSSSLRSRRPYSWKLLDLMSRASYSPRSELPPSPASAGTEPAGRAWPGLGMLGARAGSLGLGAPGAGTAGLPPAGREASGWPFIWAQNSAVRWGCDAQCQVSQCVMEDGELHPAHACAVWACRVTRGVGAWLTWRRGRA